MTQINRLVSTLKQQLKAHGKTYADVAATLQISEASVKRLFAEQSFSLNRLESICQLVGLQISELVQTMEKQSSSLQQLSFEQEQGIINDPLLFFIAINVINGYTFQDLMTDINISEPECIHKLAKLNHLRIIELLPNNRIKLLIATDFHWISNGPIQQFFQEYVEKHFFRSTFKKDGEKLRVLNGRLSKNSSIEIQKKMDKLAGEFSDLMIQDAQLPISERKNMTLVLAARQWQYQLFDQFRRS